MRKTIFRFTLTLLVLGMITAKPGFSQTPQQDYDKLKKEYEAIKVDRDNLLSQLKNSGDFKSKAAQAEASAKKLLEENSRSQQEIQVLTAQITDLRQKIDTLEADRGQLVKEGEDLKKSLEKMSFEYKIVPETKRQLADVRSQNNSLQRSVKQMESQLKKAEEDKLNNDAQQEIYRMQIKQLKKGYEKALASNRVLEKKAEALPQRFAEISRQNKTLIKETALTHYNLGVFYTKNREYTRALAEFEKAAELNPDDAASFFNLGYICAEYLVNRPKAIAYFRKYLSLTKTEDKDVDWVKKYILTWQTWEGKKPLE